MTGLREALVELLETPEEIDRATLAGLLASHLPQPAPVANRERVAEVLQAAASEWDEPIGDGDVAQMVDALLAADVFRDKAMVKAEALEEAAGESSMCDVGLPSPDAHEKATEWLLSKASKVRAGAS